MTKYLSKYLSKFLRKFCSDENGATAVEYGLIAAIMGVGLIAGVTILSDQIHATLNTLAIDMSSINTTPVDPPVLP